MRIGSIAVRTILNSGGAPSVEVELRATTGERAVASGPSALAPGGLERAPGAASVWDAEGARQLARRLEAQLAHRPFAQTSWDDELVSGLGLGTSLSVPLSVAFARLSSVVAGVPLAVWLAQDMGVDRLADRPPAFLVALVSGGVHALGHGPAVQQVMAAIGGEDATESARTAVELHATVRSALEDRGVLVGISASSGFVTRGLPSSEAIRFTSDLLREAPNVTVAIDVAAEHLWMPPDRYDADGMSLDPQQFSAVVADWAADPMVTYIEDPLHPDDRQGWTTLHDELPETVDLIGDDLFATDPDRLDPALASGVVLKVNQVGTVSSTIDAARRAREVGMVTCVSHRSLETEDHFVCHLAVATGAKYLKIGGPLRGDRTARYNEMIRLADVMGSNT